MQSVWAVRQGIESYSLSKLNVRRVSALRQIDANWIPLAVGLVIFAKPVTQPRGLHADDGVDVGVERLGAIEDFQSDVVALQPITPPSQRFIDDVLKKPLSAPRTGGTVRF